MFVIVAPTFFKYFVGKRYNAIALFPFMLLRDANILENENVIQHEKIHFKQQTELLIIPFYILYLLEFSYFLFCYKNWHLAYKAISFEREAYEHEKEPKYLSTRKPFAMWRSF